MIVVTSDHGEEFGEHGFVGWHWHTLFDELLHVPLLMKMPRSRDANAKVKVQVRSIDVAPTVLSILGLPIPAQFSGMDLSEIVSKGTAEDLPVLSYRDTADESEVWSLRVSGWKYYLGRLYDLKNDSGELVDVASQHPLVVKKLEAQMQGLVALRKTAGVTRVSPEEETVEKLRALGYVE